MERVHSSRIIAGVDVGKRWLDAAIVERTDQVRVGNDAAGIGQLCAWFVRHGVGMVGMEATGGYERDARLALEAAGIDVVLHQPIEVKLFAKLNRLRSKTDKADARLIALATAQMGRQPKTADPALMELAERLTAYEQVSDQLAELRTFLESLRLADLIATMRRQIDELKALKAALAAQMLAAIKASPALMARHRLLTSLPGIGPIVAASLVVRMPELGQMQRGQAASLAGVAPHARDSGQWQGKRFISGGRSRPRRMLYLAAMAARRHDATLKRFADALAQRGKPPKLIIVAIMRKLVEAANLVLKRNHPWTQ